MDYKDEKRPLENPPAARKKPARSSRRWKRRPVESYTEGDFFVLPPDMTDDEAILHTAAAAEEPVQEVEPPADNVVSLEELAARRQAEIAEEMGHTKVVGDTDEPPAGESTGDTRVVGDPPAAPEPPKPADEVEGQLKLDDWEDEPPVLGEDWQERLRRTRQEQIEDFERKRREKEAGLKLAGEEEINDPAEEPPAPPPEPEEEELEDYSRYEETAAVRGELLYRRRVGWITLAASAVPELLLLWLSFLSLLFFDVSVLHILISAVLLGVIMAVNHRSIVGGFKSLFHGMADADSPLAVASSITLVHTVVQMFNTQEIGMPDTAPLLFPAVAGLGLLLGAAGRQWRVCRILNNFRLVSYEGDKVAACRVEDPQDAMEIGRPAVAMGTPDVCYFKKSHFLKGFLRHSYVEDAGDERMRYYVPCSLMASLLLGIAFYIFSGSFFAAFAVLTAAVCVAAPVGMLTAVNFPLWRVSRKLVPQGAMVSGWDAVEEFGDAHALTVDAVDLFPENSVLLHGIKTFSGTRIDRAIMDAASVSIMAGGPLANVFRRVIEDNEKILQPVESLVYEQDMGVSGWVDGRRVLVGNRRLLENHGVDVPSRDYELRYTGDERQLVYLSTAGELSAMFVVSYVADEDIEDSLRALTKEGITLLIRTCDPNVTEDLVCQSYDLDRYYVEVLDAAAGRLYVRLLSEEYADREALVGSNGWIQGMAQSIAYCRRLRIGGRLAVAAQLIGCVLGFALTVFFSFYNGVPAPAFHTVWYLLGVTGLSWLLPLIKRT